MGCPNRQLLPKIEVFYRPEWTKEGNHIKMNGCSKQLERKKVDEKMGSFVQFPCFLPELWSVNCPKQCIFNNFVLISVRHPPLLKHFTYVHVKVLITLFQKMVWFIGVSATVHEILAIKISKKMLTQQKFNKILRLETLISPKQ